uniref:Uncharacterized protein n=1 Tax=Nothobranchius rachovii TaxID=451742 RepID=A0A1A8QKG3_9TELE
MLSSRLGSPTQPPTPNPETNRTQQLPFDYVHTRLVGFCFSVHFPKKKTLFVVPICPSAPGWYLHPEITVSNQHQTDQKLQQSFELIYSWTTIPFHLVLSHSVKLPISWSFSLLTNQLDFICPTNQLTLSLTAVRDSTVSSQLGQGTVDWGTMSLSSPPSPTASGSARNLALPSAAGTIPDPATPGGPEL